MTGRADHLRAVLRAELESRDAGAFVHVGSEVDPAIRYCGSIERERATRTDALVAVAFDGDEWLVRVLDDSSTSADHPAVRLARDLRERDVRDPVLTPRDVPHDAALYLERAGFSLASSDALERARATKTTGERERVERASVAAGAGVRAVASILADASVVDGRLEGDGRLEDSEGEPITSERLRRAADVAIVEAGAFPAGNTVVEAHARAGDEPIRAGKPGTSRFEPLRADEPIVLEVAPREPTGYHASLTRTLVAESEGGPERRAHVAVTSALRSARAMLAGGERSVDAVAADLEAEVLAFGFDEGVEVGVHGVGLEPRERPGRGEDLPDECVLRLEAAVTDPEWWRVEVADLLALESDGPRWLESPSRSLAPDAFEV